jgi:hypothetical protein
MPLIPEAAEAVTAIGTAAARATAAEFNCKESDGTDAADPGDDAPVEPPKVEAVDWADSDKNTDYQPKSESEGASWTFNPKKVELTYGKTDTGTNFQGARILKGDEDVVVQGQIETGQDRKSVV